MDRGTTARLPKSRVRLLTRRRGAKVLDVTPEQLDTVGMIFPQREMLDPEDELYITLRP